VLENIPILKVFKVEEEQDGGGVGDLNFVWSQEFSYIAAKPFLTPTNSTEDRRKE